jgi:hypothetical protein
MRGVALLSTLWRFSFAPRARSGRSGWASSPALRPACACDRAGTARRADPRCSPPSQETLGRGQRFHSSVWPLGSRTFRRHGSSRPRGGIHRHPPARARACTNSFAPPTANRTSGRGVFKPPGGCQRPCLRRLRVPSGRLAAGCRWRGVIRTGRGPTEGRPCSVAAGGVSERSERGRASDERPLTRRAKQKPSRSDKQESDRAAARQKKTSTKWNEQN